MKYVFLIMFFFLGFSISLASDNTESVFPIPSSGSLKFDVDVCQMDGLGDSTIVEVIYSVFLVTENIDQSSQVNTTLSIDLSITKKSGQLLERIAENKMVSLYDSVNQNNYTTFMDIKRFNLLPDTVILDLNIQDSLTGFKGQVSQAFLIRTFKNEFSLSDLYFVSHVQRAKKASIFEKGGVMMVPNPSRLFFVNGDAPKIFVYYEINNLTYDANKSTFYEVNSYVQDIAGSQMLTYPKKQIKITSENTSRIKVIPIGDLRSGVYHLRIEVVDNESGLKSEAAGYFKVDRGKIDKTNILPMSEAEEKKYLEQIKYIATDQEKEIYSRLDAIGKQEFLLNFWKSRDPSPGTPENEFMIEHFRRLDVAEKKFKGGSTSDMGRVYIMYGPPADIERQSSMKFGAQSIEIWAYVLDGRTDFVFFDRDGDGKYILIHSTHQNEYSNPDWSEQILK